MGLIITVLVAFGFVFFVARAVPGDPLKKWKILPVLQEWSPLLIGLIWVGYGILHLALPGSAEKQMQTWWGPLREPLFAASGALEIGLGLLTIAKPWRRLALVGEMALLIAMTPFVVYLLLDDDAIENLMGQALPHPLARLVVIVHNLLLFVWTHAVYRQERPVVADLPLVTTRIDSRDRATLVVAAIMLTANTAGFTAIGASPWHPAIPSLWAMASLATGALVGFVFGVPRWLPSKESATARERYVPNANIEKLSDWLTKILVGVGLIEFHRVGPVINQVGGTLAAGLVQWSGRSSSKEEALAFASAVVVYFVTAGVIQGFLLTRMFLTSAWRRQESGSDAS
jgi:hypothetical protein